MIFSRDKRERKPCRNNLRRITLVYLLIPALTLLSPSLKAHFDFTPNCQQAQLKILDLRTRDARTLLNKERSVNPENGYIIYLEQFLDVVELIVTDDEERYNRLIDSYEERFYAMDKLDDDSPNNELLQAEMLFYLGLAQVKYGSRLSGASKIYTSYLTVKRNHEEYPDFYPNLKMSGMYNIMMDFIPQSMRWITNIFGIRGDKELGMGQLMEYFEQVKSTPGLAQEAVLIINLAYKLTWQDSLALEFQDGLDPSLRNPVLTRYMYALSASFAFQNELALEKLSGIERQNLQVPFYTLDYITGRCRLYRLEEDANVPLEKFLAEYPGQDFKKDASNRLSFYYFLENNMERYTYYKEMVSNVGQDLRDRDLEAQMESNSRLIPHEGLLKARLLFDGGYFHQADSVMKSIPKSSLLLVAYQLEYEYRQGRIDQMLGEEDLAIIKLKKAAEEGAQQPFTFATRAALQLGSIYEARKNYTSALYWYERCLEYYKPEHTVGSVEDKAEKGKKRMETIK